MCQNQWCYKEPYTIYIPKIFIGLLSKKKVSKTNLMLFL